MENILKVENIIKHYGQGHTLVKAIDDVSLEVNKGELILIKGASGSGKTTLLSMIGGILKPTSGSIVIDKIEITKLTENELPKIRRENIGFIFQTFQLLSALTSAENVAVPLIANGISYKKAKQQAIILLKSLGLEQKLNRFPKDLSGGEKQRIAIARALINNPKLILADEPTANLDSQNGNIVMKILSQRAKEHNDTVIVVSHDERLIQYADRVIYIEDGKITNSSHIS